MKVVRIIVTLLLALVLAAVATHYLVVVFKFSFWPLAITLFVVDILLLLWFKPWKQR